MFRGPLYMNKEGRCVCKVTNISVLTLRHLNSLCLYLNNINPDIAAGRYSVLLFPDPATFLCYT